MHRNRFDNIQKIVNDESTHDESKIVNDESTTENSQNLPSHDESTQFVPC